MVFPEENLKPNVSLIGFISERIEAQYRKGRANKQDVIGFLNRRDKRFVNSINISIVEFPITNFLRFLEKNPKNTYHREKFMSFFLNLLEL